MKVIAVINQKGGVGKTTTAINLSVGLARSGKKALLLDLDPQANATSGLGRKVAEDKNDYGIYELLSGQNKSNETIQAIEKNLWLIPSSKDLAALEMEVSQTGNWHGLLKQRLGLLNEPEFIIIDCPPALGVLTINALTASDYVLIPMQAEFYSLEGIAQLIELYKKIKHTHNPDLAILGVLLTMFDNRNTLSKNVEDELKKYFGKLLFNVKIPRNVRLAEAPSYGISIYDHDKWSKGTKAYKSLVKEVIDRVN
jgi:chromosome partitioning protein